MPTPSRRGQVYCAHVDCRSRSDQHRFGPPRQVLPRHILHSHAELRAHHNGVLCNKHFFVLQARCTNHDREQRIEMLDQQGEQQPQKHSARHKDSLAEEGTEHHRHQGPDHHEEAAAPHLLGVLLAAVDPSRVLVEAHTASSAPPLPLSSTSGVGDEPASPVDTVRRPRQSRRAVPTMISLGWRPPAAIEASLAQLTAAHRRLTGQIWNGSSYHLVAADDADISVANGEMQQQPYCDLLHTLITHDNIPADCRLQTARLATNQFFLDIGSGYGLAVLRAQLLSGVAVCGGVEVARDRVFVSHRLAEAVGLSTQAQFVDADACSPSVLPILNAATHLFAYSAVFSLATRAYLAGSVIASDDSNWLVYVTFDKADVLEQAGVKVSCTRHEEHCTEGGAHLLGKTSPLSMSVSGQKLQAHIFVRCTRPSSSQSATRFAEGVQLLNTLAANSRRRGQQAIEQLMTSTATETRASKRQ